MRRAKIVCTLGPAVSSPRRIRELVYAGMDVARLNMSHGSHKDHAEAYRLVREASDASGHGVGILADLQGPKIRLENFSGGPVQLSRGQSLIVWAIAEGRAAAAAVDRFLTGSTTLPAPIKPTERPLVV